MTVQDITILGAGPCGLSAAIALAKKHAGAQEPPLRITILELRPRLQTIGGTINLTPVATRYIDYLGAGKRLRERAIDLENGLDYISMRSGKRIGNIWGGIGAIRVARHRLVESLLQTIMEEHSDAIRIQWDRRVAEISESESKAVMRFEDGDTLTADVLLGCDGLHSTARRLWVEPERTKTFTGRVITMGWSDQPAGMTLSSGEPALRDTALISSPNGILLSSYYEPTRTKTYLAHIMPMAEPDGGARDGWKAAGEDKAAIRREIVETYQSGQVRGLQEVVSKCEDWHLYPVYVLPAGGRWHRGRVLLLGDAAHAMPPQGESTGLAIEDGVLIAEVLGRRASRTIEQLFADYETVRKPVIDRYYSDAIRAMKYGFIKTSGLTFILLEWVVWLYLLIKKWRQQEHFASDVRRLELPA